MTDEGFENAKSYIKAYKQVTETEPFLIKVRNSHSLTLRISQKD